LSIHVESGQSPVQRGYAAKVTALSTIHVERAQNVGDASRLVLVRSELLHNIPAFISRGSRGAAATRVNTRLGGGFVLRKVSRRGL
jgi:hypothetical protein